MPLKGDAWLVIASAKMVRRTHSDCFSTTFCRRGQHQQRCAWSNADRHNWLLDRPKTCRKWLRRRGVAAITKFAFDDLNLHRLEICIIPRNSNSKRIAEKLGLRLEGLAERFLEINGVWEDHLRYAITAEEWLQRREALTQEWLTSRK